MLIKTQRTEDDYITFRIIDTAHVVAWEIAEQDYNADLFAIIPGITDNCLFVGTFDNSKKAENWLDRMFTSLAAGRQFMVVPSLSEQNIEKESAQWD